MTVQRLLGWVAVMLIVASAVAVSQLNGAPTTLVVPGLRPVAAPLWALVFAGVLTGGILTAGFFTALSSRDAMARWRQERLDRQAARLDRLHADGIRALLAGESGRAQRLFLDVTEVAPERGEAWLLAGDAARGGGDAELATEFHLRAQGLMPDDPRVLEALSRDAESGDDVERARRYQEQLIERQGATLVRRERQRDLAIKARDWGVALAAEQECARGRKRSQAEEELLRGLRIEAAAADAAAGDSEAALIAARRLANEAPDFEPAYDVLAELHRAAGDAEAMAAVLEEGYAATASLGLLQRLVSLRLELEQPEAAITVLRDASGRLDTDAALAARIMLGRLYHRVGLVEEADEEFASVADRVKRSPVVDYYRARAARRRGDAEAAYEGLRQSIRAAGYLDVRYACQECDAEHAEYARRCCRCGRWATLEMDISRDARAAEPARAPVI
jgi:tetratricopeptide (TPR) repeat protein